MPSLHVGTGNAMSHDRLRRNPKDAGIGLVKFGILLRSCLADDAHIKRLAVFHGDLGAQSDRIACVRQGFESGGER